jgi:hypothetical protein
MQSLLKHSRGSAEGALLSTILQVEHYAAEIKNGINSHDHQVSPDLHSFNPTLPYMHHDGSKEEEGQWMV